MVQFSILKTDLGSFGILVNESDLLKVILPNKINSISMEITNPGSYKPIMHNAANPIPIIIPCHRVIQSNGSLGNYGGGRQLKQILVQIEKNK